MTNINRTSALLYLLVIYVMIALTALARADAPQVEIVHTTTICSPTKGGKLQCVTTGAGRPTKVQECRLVRGKLSCRDVVRRHGHKVNVL